MTDLRDEVFQRCDDLGEDEVRKRVAAGLYAERKLKFINEWLRKQHQERIEFEERVRADSNREQISIARNAKNAQIIAAIAATALAIVAIITLILNWPD